jgi:hypothetical protein
MDKLSNDWIVFLKVLDKKPLKTYKEFKAYRRIFKKVFEFNAHNKRIIEKEDDPIEYHIGHLVEKK